MGPGRDWTRDPWICSQTRICSQTCYRLRYAARRRCHCIGQLNTVRWLLSDSLGVVQKWAMTCDFQQCGILTCVDTNKPVQFPFKLRNSKWCSVSSLTLIEYSRLAKALIRLRVYVQAGLSLCWPHIPHCWKSHVAAQMSISCVLEASVSCSIISLLNFPWT